MKRTKQAARGGNAQSYWYSRSSTLMLSPTWFTSNKIVQKTSPAWRWGFLSCSCIPGPQWNRPLRCLGAVSRKAMPPDPRGGSLPWGWSCWNTGTWCNALAIIGRAAVRLARLCQLCLPHPLLWRMPRTDSVKGKTFPLPRHLNSKPWTISGHKKRKYSWKASQEVIISFCFQAA